MGDAYLEVSDLRDQEVRDLRKRAAQVSELLPKHTESLRLCQTGGHSRARITKAERQKRDELVWDLLDIGCSPQEIAYTLGCSKRHVYRILSA